MSSHHTRHGYIYALAAFGLWGVIPLFFKALIPIDSMDIVAHRVLYAVPTLALLIFAKKRWGDVKAALGNRKVMLTLFASAVLIAINWVVYVVGVNGGRVLATSLGYYLNPLFNILIGHFLLKEHLSRSQWAALAIAGLGVGALALGALGDLWITLSLAFSFAFYGYLRKQVNVGAAPGLFIETLLLAPLFLIWLGALRDMGDPLMGPTPLHTALLLVSGLVTALPLLLFTEGARRLPYSTIGILQFIAPTLQFLMGFLLFGEILTPVRAFAFAAIWIAMALYIKALVGAERAKRVSLAKQSS
ncbi:EamA family transporter RarD [Sphingomicrobium lutaoense]|uniref:Chloramphenicol-sensitive protein RarD n=1 Tax=Sphingomicrobium lutaoense TaxID=515949 RepID=A0A839Z0J8_9SPHN|nr:EamA family transporter RarD [Sphingomicrobium lutaoense]MBB3763085.1 chloramphenicol-sensitive protein RarD [Sphingomicrobium lutaoense]